jgi:hypothetical protein
MPLNGLKESTPFGKTIQLSTEGIHLGLNVDKGLAWDVPLDEPINRDFWTCRSSFVKTGV